MISFTNVTFCPSVAYNSVDTALPSLPLKKNIEAPHAAELNLVKKLLAFPLVVAEVSKNYETQKLPFYCQDLATKFHDFYTNCRVIDHDTVITERLALIKATKIVLAKSLGLMGVSAPEEM